MAKDVLGGSRHAVSVDDLWALGEKMRLEGSLLGDAIHDALECWAAREELLEVIEDGLARVELETVTSMAERLGHVRDRWLGAEDFDISEANGTEKFDNWYDRVTAAETFWANVRRRLMEKGWVPLDASDDYVLSVFEAVTI